MHYVNLTVSVVDKQSNRQTEKQYVPNCSIQMHKNTTDIFSPSISVFFFFQLMQAVCTGLKTDSWMFG